MVLITVIGQKGMDSGLVGRKKVFYPDGEAGEISTLPWLEAGVSRLARDTLEKGVFTVADLTDPEQPDRSVTLMADPYLPPPELVILGGGHIALHLARVGKMLGYLVTVADDRPDFASPARFPEADRVVCCDFTRITERLTFGPRSSVVIVTRGHRHDLDCLRQVIGRPVAYLGMIGSRRKIRQVRQQLAEEGVPERQLDAVHMPIGLDIGAQTPAEIAVSIAAELIMERRGGAARPLRECPPGAGSGTAAGDSEMPSAVYREILKEAVKSSGGEVPAALATIVRTRGSTPRKAGARMLVYRDGRAVGTIGGGCGESGVRREAFNAMDEGTPRLYKVALDADTAAGEGMACGGAMEVFIEPAGMLAGVFGRGENIESR
ncbi:MAG: XdhC family protein [Peptococcaceae bacterium]|nr:XdhC family protein [Peptococcaceae bacterium]